MDEKPVIVYPSDGSASGLYRLTWPAQAVAAMGKPVIVMPRSPEIIVDENNTVQGISLGNYQVVIFQRPASYQFSQAIPILQRQGVKVVIDCDDSLSTIHPRNAAFKTYDPRVHHQRNWMHAARACELADLVTVTTPALLEEYGYGHGVVIPNHIPESYLKIERPINEVPVVGWAGYTSTHIDDLSVTCGMINQALVETDAKFAAFGDEKIFFDLGIKYRPPNEHWGFTNIPEYPKILAGMDIGLVPLQKSEFNSKKSFLKGLEYSATGVVPVMSPTPDNLKLHKMGIGLIASTPKEWYDHVKTLILDNEMRAEMSKKGREIAAGLTIEGNWRLWHNAWNNA